MNRLKPVENLSVKAMEARACFQPILVLCFLLASGNAQEVKVTDEAAHCYESGYALLTGNGGHTDAPAARLVLERAVALGNGQAKGLLGYMLAEGMGGPPDLQRGFGLVQEAASTGIASAKLNLGSMFEKGRGTQKDLKRAVELYGQAAEQGSLDAHLRLADFYYFGTPEVTTDYLLALPHVKFAAAKGVPSMQNLLGVMYEYGQGVTPAYSEARIWYREAAIQGDAKGQSNLGRIIRLRHSRPSDLVESAQWTKLAASQGEPTAKVALIDLENGLDAGQKLQVNQFVAAFRPVPSPPDQSNQPVGKQ